MNDKNSIFGSPVRFGRNYQMWQAFIVRLNHAPVGFKAMHLMPERRLMFEKIGENLYRLTSGPLIEPNKPRTYLVISHLEQAFNRYIESMIGDNDQVTRRGSMEFQINGTRYRWINDRHQLEGHGREYVVVFLPGWWHRFSGHSHEIEYECRARFETVLYIDEQLGR